MKTITIKDIEELDPCYSPTKYLSEDWTGTVLDILNVDECPIKDRFWVVLREEFIDAKTLRLFAVWCAREALKLAQNPDDMSVKAVDTAEKYANGEATREELKIAESNVWSASKTTKIVWSAAHTTKKSAEVASYLASLTAAWSADSAAWSADSAVRKLQLKKLKELIKGV